ncbi:metal-dependent hydrolase [Actinokineospora sp. G85]|uniref:metal-dependent hydrolase n=1 Tax=Actinokineospora sp. G85 TaxID=3406626 RepID=UPI003C78C41D
MSTPIKPRRIRFDYGPATGLETGERRHYVQGDLVMSHVVATLSAMFPEGEDFFVRSVRHYAGRITDPRLKKDVAGFIGQEVTHGREHRDLNDRLQEMGYPTHRVDRMVKRALSMYWKRLPKISSLAVTSALEHYTAALAETLLIDPRAQELLGTSEVRSVLLWHAIEESEHKAVAFDVYRAVGGTEKRRIWTMRWMTFSFLFGVTMHTLLSLAGDKAARNPKRLFKSFAALRHSPFLTKEVRQRIRDYNRVGFHPNDNDNTALLEKWTKQLFGEQGELAHNLK